MKNKLESFTLGAMMASAAGAVFAHAGPHSEASPLLAIAHMLGEHGGLLIAIAAGAIAVYLKRRSGRV